MHKFAFSHRKHIYLKVTEEGNQAAMAIHRNGSAKWWDFPPLNESWHTLIFLSLSTFHSPFLSNLKGHKQRAYAYAGEGRTKKGQKNKNSNPRTKSQLHKREYVCTQNATRDREMQMKQKK